MTQNRLLNFNFNAFNLKLAIIAGESCSMPATKFSSIRRQKRIKNNQKQNKHILKLSRAQEGERPQRQVLKKESEK